MKKRILLGLLFLVLLLAGAAAYLYANLERYVPPNLVPPASYWVDEDKPLREQAVRVEIAGRVFNIPKMYIDSKMPLSGVIKDSVLLEVIWPDMRSIYELKDRQEYERIWKHEGRRGWILLHAAAAKPSLDDQTANRRLGLTKEEYVGTEAGLEKYLWYHGMPDAPRIWAELYFESDLEGHVITRIECRLGEGVVVPGCSQKFIDSGLLYEISYNKASFFSEWREQRKRAIDFLHSVEITGN